jgi:hypothetical protein
LPWTGNQICGWLAEDLDAFFLKSNSICIQISYYVI